MSTGNAAAELPRSSLAEAVAKRIEARIAEDALPNGHRLGTRDSLRREFDVAAATLNEAVRLLAARYVSLLEFVGNRLHGVMPDDAATRHVDGPGVHRELVEAIAGDDPERLDAAVAAHTDLTATHGGGV
ncbi:hypothetical protein [Actinomadura sp. 3N407]|uniref:hypothetical protein n=1 Tax=Actinomadura sp. 3N407 TaxID=3457423 RepID=UPI003FCC630A